MTARPAVLPRSRRQSLKALVSQHGRLLSKNIDSAIAAVRQGTDGAPEDRARLAAERLEAWSPYAQLVDVSAVDLLLIRFRALRDGAPGPISDACAELRLVSLIVGIAQRYFSGAQLRMHPGAKRGARMKAIRAIDRLEALRADGCLIGISSDDEKLASLLRHLRSAMQHRKPRSEVTSRERYVLDLFAVAVQSTFRIEPAASVSLLSYFAEALGIIVDVRTLGRYASVALPPFDDGYFMVSGRKRRKIAR